MEKAGAWAEAKAKERAEIPRIDAEDMERARVEAEARVWDKTNVVKMQRRSLPPISYPRRRPREKR